MQHDNADNLVLRGAELLAAGRFAEADALFREAMRLSPKHVKALHGLAFALHNLGRSSEATPLLQQALEMSPRDAELHNMLGAVREHLKQHGEAADAYRQALALDPSNAIYHSNLALMLRVLERRSEALAEYQAALTLDPNLVVANFNFAALLHLEARFDEAETYYRKVLSRQDSAAVWGNLASVLYDLGRAEEADAAYRRALALEPVERLEHDLLLLQFHREGISADDISQQHRRWAQQRYASKPPTPRPPPRRSPSGSRLRIGYVSADFREHPIAFFIEPLLRAHDRSRVEVFCYSQSIGKPQDPYREHLRRLSDHWRAIEQRSDAEVVRQIADDAIDVLVDLGGHTGDGRLGIFAARAAPVQVSYLGYPGTTGLPQMDYRLSDSLADPPGLTDALHTERLIRLPDTLACYSPPAVAPPPVAAPPVAANGFVTFGVVARPLKISASALDLWASVLAKLPDSRLQMLIGAADRSVERRLMQEMTRRGVAPERVRFFGKLPLAEFLSQHNRVDVVLDTVPFNGHTTTCHALWMGVPVVSLAGQSFASRLGLSVLTNVGLPDLVATSSEQFIDIACGLATNVSRLRALRTGLRDQMRSSPLMNAPTFVRHVEAAFAKMHQAAADAAMY